MKNHLTKKAGYIWFLGLKLRQKPFNKPTIIGTTIAEITATHQASNK